VAGRRAGGDDAITATTIIGKLDGSDRTSNLHRRRLGLEPKRKDWRPDGGRRGLRRHFRCQRNSTVGIAFMTLAGGRHVGNDQLALASGVLYSQFGAAGFWVMAALSISSMPFIVMLKPANGSDRSLPTRSTELSRRPQAVPQ
jgi:hypothetical protein